MSTPKYQNMSLTGGSRLKATTWDDDISLKMLHKGPRGHRPRPERPWLVAAGGPESSRPRCCRRCRRPRCGHDRSAGCGLLTVASHPLDHTPIKVGFLLHLSGPTVSSRSVDRLRSVHTRSRWTPWPSEPSTPPHTATAGHSFDSSSSSTIGTPGWRWSTCTIPESRRPPTR